MPTAARVVAAIMIALIAWVVSGMAKAVMPSYMTTGYLMPISVIVGALCGWKILGVRSDYGRLGYPNAIGVGLSAMVATVIWVVLICAALRALRHALDGRYDGPMSALYDVFPIAAEFATYLATVPTILTLVIGGMVAGAVTHWASLKWR